MHFCIARLRHGHKGGCRWCPLQRQRQGRQGQCDTTQLPKQMRSQVRPRSLPYAPCVIVLVVAMPPPLVNHRYHRYRHLTLLTSCLFRPLSLPCLSPWKSLLTSPHAAANVTRFASFVGERTRACPLDTSRPMLCALSSTISPEDS